MGFILHFPQKIAYPYQSSTLPTSTEISWIYGDNGNILMLKYVAEKLREPMCVDIVSLHDMTLMKITTTSFFSVGQETLNKVSLQTTYLLKESIDNYIHNDGVVLAICGGFQLLGQYYVEASGKRVEGLGVMGHYTLNHRPNRFIGDIKIHNMDFEMKYYGDLKITKVVPSSLMTKNRGQVESMEGNKEEKRSVKGFYIRISLVPFHGPISSRNANLAYRLV